MGSEMCIRDRGVRAHSARIVGAESRNGAGFYDSSDDDQDIGDTRFVRYTPDLRGGAVRDEYEDLLSVFGVRPGVQLKHIKNAYRNAVKHCHPDLNKNTTSADADRFIYLTQAYDRLLRLHEQRTGEH